MLSINIRQEGIFEFIFIGLRGSPKQRSGLVISTDDRNTTWSDVIGVLFIYCPYKTLDWILQPFRKFVYILVYQYFMQYKCTIWKKNNNCRHFFMKGVWKDVILWEDFFIDNLLLNDRFAEFLVFILWGLGWGFHPLFQASLWLDTHKVAESREAKK